MKAPPLPPILDVPPKKLLAWLVGRVERVGVDAAEFREAAEACWAFFRKKEVDRDAARRIRVLEERWYRSLSRGEPDWSVYDGTAYLGELWSCWAVYSREYLRLILTPQRGMPDSGLPVAADLGLVRRVVDVGCGFGLTTWALKDIWPDAEVLGTNLPGTVQYDLAEEFGLEAGFSVHPTGEGFGPADLVFASEYFEHFERPLEHLAEVLDRFEPRALLVANAFGAKSIGHFDRYVVGGGEAVPGREVHRHFAEALGGRGYEKVKTNLWNNRPAYWRRGEGGRRG